MFGDLIMKICKEKNNDKINLFESKYVSLCNINVLTP